MIRADLQNKKTPFADIALYVVLVLSVAGLAGCGATDPYYSSDEGRPQPTDQQFDQQDVRYSLFLIGDAGDAKIKPLSPNLRMLQHHLELAGENSTVIFMGDNIYEEGLHAEDHPNRAEEERRINAQMGVFKSYAGQGIFIPGNHDWNDDKPRGVEILKRQQEYIEKRLGDSAFAPDEGCPGPVEVQIDSSNVLVLMDTQWWLYPHEKPGLETCKNGSRERLVHATDSLIQAYSDQNIFVIGHHPLFSNGKHNGYLPVTDHLFPLLDYSPVLYIPLPIIGSIKPLYRKHIGYLQDLPGKEYSALREQLVAVFEQHPNLVYVAGHDHSLQYHPIEGQHYIVSGAGTNQSYVRRGKTAAFAYTRTGFARIDILSDRVVLSFLTPEKNMPEGRLVYQKILYDY